MLEIYEIDMPKYLCIFSYLGALETGRISELFAPKFMGNIRHLQDTKSRQ